MLNKHAKLIRSLQQKKYRKTEGLFLVEGAKSVAELLNSELQTEALFYTEKFAETAAKFSGLSVFEEVKAGALSANGTFKTNDSALALVRIPDDSRPLPLRAGEYVLVCDDIRDPGNLGTLIRISDWYGCRQIFCSPDTADAWNPKVISATMGSFCRIRPIFGPLDELLAGFSTVYGTFLNGENVHQTQFDRKSGAIIIGNEARGIRPETEKLVDCRLTIPAYGAAESLNAGAAAAVICDNMRRSLSVNK